MLHSLLQSLPLTQTRQLDSLLASGVTPYWHFSGVFHPAIAHFPIALLIVAGIIELLGLFKRGRRPGPATLWCLWLGALSAIAAAIFGWANADAAQEFSGKFNRIVFLHRWLGIAVAAAGLTVAIFAAVAARSRAGSPAVWITRLGSLAVAALVGLVGSFGGKLTHGPDYYADAYKTLQSELHPQPALAIPALAALPAALPATNPHPDTPPAPVPQPVSINANPAPANPNSTIAAAPPDKVSYSSQIKPLFEANCLKCHNELKQKGGYRLDSKIFALNAGESGEKAIVPGNAQASLIIKLIEGKGKYADGRMPPKGTLLTSEQAVVLRKWIDQGADWPD